MSLPSLERGPLLGMVNRWIAKYGVLRAGLSAMWSPRSPGESAETEDVPTITRYEVLGTSRWFSSSTPSSCSRSIAVRRDDGALRNDAAHSFQVGQRSRS